MTAGVSIGLLASTVTWAYVTRHKGLKAQTAFLWMHWAVVDFMATQHSLKGTQLQWSLLHTLQAVFHVGSTEESMRECYIMYPSLNQTWRMCKCLIVSMHQHTHGSRA